MNFPYYSIATRNISLWIDLKSNLFSINIFNVKLKIAFMKFFAKEKVIVETKCRECGMEFSESERMLRHMIKAHTKKKPSCNC
jgi:hypothetical protein